MTRWLSVGFVCVLAGSAVAHAATTSAARRAPAIGFAGSPSRAAHIQRDQVAISEAKKVLDDHLLDYPSTRFRGVSLVHTQFGFDAFCGEMNTKNRMGGYAGWKRFAVTVGDGAESSPIDRVTISGQTTTMAAFMSQYGTGSPPDENMAEKVIDGMCVTKATNADGFDYSAYLSAGGQ